MYHSKGVLEAIKKAYAGMLFDEEAFKGIQKTEELDEEEIAQGLEAHSEIVYSYETDGTFDMAIQYHGPELFGQRACMLLQYPLLHSAALVGQEILRELWFLEDMTFVEITKVVITFWQDNERFISTYRVIRYEVDEENWLRYDPDDFTEALEDICRIQDGHRKQIIYEV